MNHYRPSDNELNAYVDGELDAATRAQVAHAIALDSGLARRVAQLTALKAALPNALPDLPEIEFGQAPKPANDNSPWRRPLIASILMVFVVGAAITGYLGSKSAEEQSASWRAAAKSKHEIWAAEHVPTSTGSVLPASLATTGVKVPDLAAARLTLQVLDRVRLGAVDATHLGYTGTRGCRVSLFILDKAEPGAKPKMHFPSDMRVAEWRGAGRDYLLLSSGMDADRFELLARTLESFTLRPAPFDSRTEQQLAESRRATRACLA